MARTFGGLIYYSAPQIEVASANRGASAGQYALVRNALGDVSLNNTAGVSTVQFWTTLEAIKRPYFSFPAFPGQGTVPLANEYQEAFGSAGAAGAPGPGNPMSGGTGLAFSGTPGIPWGIAVVDVFAVYSVLTATLTTATIGVNRASYTENVAFTNTAILAATGISTALTGAAASPHVQKVSLAQPLVFESTDASDIQVELLITTQGTSAVRVYGIGVHLAVEFA